MRDSKNISNLLGGGAPLREGDAIRARPCIEGIAFRAAIDILGGDDKKNDGSPSSSSPSTAELV